MIDAMRVKDTFFKLTAIDSPSFGERQMADYLTERFQQLGISLSEDDGKEKLGGTAGNLYAFVKGDLEMDPILLSSHMDTVAPALGKKAILHADGRITSDGTTVLGADDLAGVTSIIEAISYIKENKLPHRSFELLFTAAEELYCKGAAVFDYSKIRSKSAYVLDMSGPVGDAAYAAPTIISFRAVIHGKASHAGFMPEAGIHSMQAGCRAVSRMQLGRIDEETTVNAGIFHSGKGTNIIPEWCEVSGEVRSLKHEKAVCELEKIRTLFQEEADRIGADVQWNEETHIKAYETSQTSPAILAYRKACEAIGIDANIRKTFGGSDNNVFALHGIEGIVTATAMNQVHSCEEYTEISELVRSTELVVGLLLDQK